MARKLVVSVLRSVVGVRREARVRLRAGLETRPGAGPSWAGLVGGRLDIGLIVVETIVGSEARSKKKRSVAEVAVYGCDTWLVVEGLLFWWKCSQSLELAMLMRREK